MRKSYPDADWRPAHPNNYSAGLNRPNKIIIHVVQGTWGSALNWFQNAASGVAAHFTVATTGRIGQSLGDLAAGYHAGNWTYNKSSIGIEHAGYVSDPSWFTDEMYHASARLVAWLCKKHGIPVDRKHILAHSQIPGTTHTDPGPHWNWPRYMNLIRQYRWGKKPSPSTPSAASSAASSDVLYRPRSGLFSEMEGAEALAEVQQARGIPASAEPSDGLYATYNGAFSERSGAAARLEEVRGAGWPEAFIETVKTAVKTTTKAERGVSMKSPPKAPGPTVAQKVDRGVATARRYKGTPYGFWTPGENLHVSKLLTPAQMRRAGAVCSDVPNVFYLANNMEPPKQPGVLQGGTLAWGNAFGKAAVRYRRGRKYPAGTLFIIPYRGPKLADQGHVMVSTTAGRNPRLIQSTPKGGWHEKRRLWFMRAPVWAVPPGRWLGAGGLDRR